MKGVWYDFVSCLASLYIDLPVKMRVDQSSRFTTVRWDRPADVLGIIFQNSGVEAYSSLDSSIRLYDPRRRIFNEIKQSLPKA